ncbi:MAG: DUF6065 family protein [Phycisphaerales bacterium JB043]
MTNIQPAHPTLTAYVVSDTTDWVIEPASPKRTWMDEHSDRFPYRCLPLVIANQAGWIIRCPLTFDVTWDGTMHPTDCLSFNCDPGVQDPGRFVASHFGNGILTFRLPWLFRTSDDLATIVRGPTNEPKLHAIPLDGIVETNWAPYTFTMNWRVIEPHKTVRFEKGEPICMILPYPIALLNQISTSIRPIDDDPGTHDDYTRWRESREAMIHDENRTPADWQKHYFQGKRPDGQFAENHFSRLSLGEFATSQG